MEQLKSKMKCLVAGSALLFSVATLAAPTSGKYFDHAVFVLFENTNYAEALKQPFFGELARNGALFSNFLAASHPSQGNYVALTSGSTQGVRDDENINLDVRNVVDLLEAKGLTWKVYVEDYPGNCFTGATSSGYARKHNPFISYLDIQKVPARCANIVNADQFDQDAAAGVLPRYAFYIPNNKNSGHDTGISYADRWYGRKFAKYVHCPDFLKDTVLISTFDESGVSAKNQIYTTIVGGGVATGVHGDALNLYSLLKLIEDNWSLGNLGLGDATATPVPNIWK